VEALGPKDEPGATRLFAEVFGKAITAEQYRWKLLNSPIRIGAATVWIAKAGDRVVGHFAGTPLQFKLGDQIVPAVHGCDVMTAAEFRHQGVLTEVGSAALRAWGNAGVPFVIGLHNGRWGTRHDYLGLQDQFELVWMRCPLQFGQLLGRRRGVPRPIRRVTVACDSMVCSVRALRAQRRARGVRVARMEQPGAELDELWDRLKDSYEAIAVRTREWIAYRYFNAPGYDYRVLLASRGDRPVGYLIYRVTDGKRSRTGWIVDLFAHPTDTRARASLLLRSLTDLQAIGAASVRTLVPAAASLVRDLRFAGFRRTVGSYPVVVIPLDSGSPDPRLRDARRWFTMLGDFDVR
jgi:hypothetical protein